MALTAGGLSKFVWSREQPPDSLRVSPAAHPGSIGEFQLLS